MNTGFSEFIQLKADDRDGHLLVASLQWNSLEERYHEQLMVGKQSVVSPITTAIT